MGWFSFDVLSGRQGTVQVTRHEKDVNLICYAQEMLTYQDSTCSASDENGQITDGLWYHSAIPYHSNVFVKRALPTSPLGMVRITQTEDDLLRSVRRTQDNIWRNSYSNHRPRCYTLSNLDKDPSAHLTSPQVYLGTTVEKPLLGLPWWSSS